VPLEKLGRVSSVDALGTYALLPVGFGLTGWLVDGLGASLVCILGGAITVALTAAGLGSRAIHALD
jgi:DHA3 family tetracycline resistance protein-like MFS transporter